MIIHVVVHLFFYNFFKSFKVFLFHFSKLSLILNSIFGYLLKFLILQL